jgi:alginate O-acetyltransferase complex protein AlgI
VKKLNLVVASYIFYAAWNPPFVILIWIVTVINWFGASWLHRARTDKKRSFFLALCLLCNFSILGYFKYGTFLLDNFISLTHTIGIEYQPARPDIVLPIGISFYTFHTLSYTIDVYRGTLRPWRAFLDFALFVVFFPLLLAGPIIRAANFLPQCELPRRATRSQLSWGLYLLLIGLCGKVVVADGFMAPISDAVFSCHDPVRWYHAWAGTLAFSSQILFDFAGYSTCAVGIALCLGFALPDNFRYPYGAIGFSDFWRRWHISLSSWLRDYLYISLGGNRKGVTRTYMNLMATMLLGGLWHGASWTFVAWGGLHGLYLCAERLLERLGFMPSSRSPLLAQLLAVAITYGAVCLTWVLSRAHPFSLAYGIAASMVGLEEKNAVGVLSRQETVLVLIASLAIVGYL